MARMKWVSTLVLAAFWVAGCGGSEKKPAPPEPIQVEEEEEEEELIPEEKFDEIRHTFERKSITVARCFPLAVEAGEVDQEARIKVSVGLVIRRDGSPSKLKIIGSSQRSKTLESCILESVGRWEFTTLPKPLPYSYGFKLQRF